MLELKNIKKDYPAGNGLVHALKGITLDFRDSEFVSILGPSGCGKTTLLNIVGGLDGYTEGDLIINGVSTKSYKDRDWDTYRNHSIGFVFQSYNLIPHQSVLQNVEIALTLSGVSKSERRVRAKDALIQVGLGDQFNKKPSQLSGGQMQRVAIARALVNNPDIILADEPTGALDTETSVQVMEILKEVSKDRLVIMVTHNPDLAEKYSSRIINMLDGNIINDSAPIDEEELNAMRGSKIANNSEEKKAAKRQKKPSMSFWTSFMLSLKNLFTKKGRTTLTAFAGSIGIIGIALILAVSQGMTLYIDDVQESTLSAYPLTLEGTTIDISALMQSFMNKDDGQDHDNDAIYKDPIIGELVNALSKVETNKNDLRAFKVYLEEELRKKDSPLREAISGINYSYSLNPIIYTKNPNGDIIKSDTNELMMEMLGDFMMQIMTGEKDESSSSGLGNNANSNMMTSMMMGGNMWEELLSGLEDEDGKRPLVNDLLLDQYDVIHGKWPESKEEIVLIVNERNEIDDLTLYALGLLDKSEIDAIIDAAASGEELPQTDKKWTYEEICELTFKTVFPYDCYEDIDGDGVYQNMSENSFVLEGLYEEALELRVVGIIRPSEDAETTMLSGAIGYTYALTEHIISEAENSDVVKAQIASPSVDVLTGLPFKSNTGSLNAEEKKEAFVAYIGGLGVRNKAEIYSEIMALEAVKAQLDMQVEGLMDNFNDRDQLIDMICTMAGESSTISADRLREMFADKTLEELKSMIRPAIEESVSEQIKVGIREKLKKDMKEDQMAAALDLSIATYTDEQFELYYDEVTEFSNMSYDQVLISIGCLDLDDPSAINLFASSFENKDIIVDTITAYNNKVEEDQKIAYTDYLGIMMSSITTIINAITYVLIAFVAISLVVSSIMIGVITLISVQERTKEIGILRAIGASKKNVSRMFNAETMIIGFASGLLGILVTYLLCIPINLILNALTGIANLNAVLPVSAAIVLVIISVMLTLVSGIIPSKSAAKKDPVVALRTE